MIVDTSANRYPVQRVQSVIRCDESIIRAFDEVRRLEPSIAKIVRTTKDCITVFWQNEAKMANTFKGGRLNAAVPFGALATLF
jgi:hypothetical protein